jgi:hypothetical protein
MTARKDYSAPCAECNGVVYLPREKVASYQRRGWQMPKRCSACQEARYQERQFHEERSERGGWK